MGKSYLLFATALLCVNSVIAQDTFLFTWHGDSNYFHASFEVTSDDMMPGTNFESDLFYNSISITNPLGQTYFSHSYDYPEGSYSPWSIHVYMFDWLRYTHVAVIGGNILGATRPMSGIIDEQNQGYPYNTFGLSRAIGPLRKCPNQQRPQSWP